MASHHEENIPGVYMNTSDTSKSPSTVDEDEVRTYAWAELVPELPGFKGVARVPASYLNDAFNFHELRDLFEKRRYKHCLEIIRGTVSSRHPIAARGRPPVKEMMNNPLFGDALRLYALVHARYILTRAGQEDMRQKYVRGYFGKCTRFHCKRQPCLPYGPRTEYRKNGWLKFCPRCKDLHWPNHKKGERYLDGAFFGPTFAPFFWMEHPNLHMQQDDDDGSSGDDEVELLDRGTFKPRVFGFRVASEETLQKWKALGTDEIHGTKRSPPPAPSNGIRRKRQSSSSKNGKKQKKKKQRRSGIEPRVTSPPARKREGSSSVTL